MGSEKLISKGGKFNYFNCNLKVNSEIFKGIERMVNALIVIKKK